MSRPPVTSSGSWSPSGDQAGALAAYQRLAARLGAELGVSPAAETTRLVAVARKEPPQLAIPACAERTAGTGASRLVGRDGEVRALLRHWRASRAGGGTAVAISGDGGMGKTRLAREVLDVAAADGALTATASAGGPGAAAPFALWSELLDDLIAQAGPLPRVPAPVAKATGTRRWRLSGPGPGHRRPNRAWTGSASSKRPWPC